MDVTRIHQLLTQVQNHEIDIEEALQKLRSLPFDDLEDYAKLDMHRTLRQGLPEVVFCEGKTPDQVVGIIDRLYQSHDKVMGTRASKEIADQVIFKFPEAIYNPISRLITLSKGKTSRHSNEGFYAAVVTGGTSDQPVAEEAAQTLEFFGSHVKKAYDVGVAGIHRLLDRRNLLFEADVVISVAGMEGALTSVVGGLVSCPVIGVPTSVGYGANFDGLSALLSMLNSCATGVAVVNIDNGFGAGVFAHKILQRMRSQPSFNIKSWK
jgi:NCAIR mutase (PurE)-related protein